MLVMMKERRSSHTLLMKQRGTMNNLLITLKYQFNSNRGPDNNTLWPTERCCTLLRSQSRAFCHFIKTGRSASAIKRPVERSITLYLSSGRGGGGGGGGGGRSRGAESWVLTIFLQAIKPEDITTQRSPLTRTDICTGGS